MLSPHRLVTLLLCCASIVLATPLEKRQKATLKPTDYEIINFALILEHMEDTYYRQGLANFTEEDFKKAGYAEKLHTDLTAISSNERKHVHFLSKALRAVNATPVPECEYNFPVKTVKDLLTTAAFLENVGLSAYTGLTQWLTKDTYINDIVSIFAVEARHSTYLRFNALGKRPYPYAYDTPLDWNSILTLISPFIASCDQAPEGTFPSIPGISKFPGLDVDLGATEKLSDPHKTKGALVDVNDTITLFTPGYELVRQYKADELWVGWKCGPTKGTLLPATPLDVKGAPDDDGRSSRFKSLVPHGMAGQAYVFLVNCNCTISDESIIAGPAVVEIGD